MTSHPNWYTYLVSLASELDVQSRRVRDLIGNRHWLSDGHHKEYLLIALLNRHLPAGMVASRGFVISPYDCHVCSREQDILVIDALANGPVFAQGHLLVAFPRQVRAAVAVKSTLTKHAVIDTIDGLNGVRRVATGESDPHTIWCGGYFFDIAPEVERNPALVYQYIQDGIRAEPAQSTMADAKAPLGPNLLCSGQNLAYVSDFSHEQNHQEDEWRVLGYECNGLATGLFLAHLLEHLAFTRGAAHSDFSDFADVASLQGLAEPFRLIPHDERRS